MIESLQHWLSPRPPRKVTRDQSPIVFAQGAAVATFEHRYGVEVFVATHDMSKAGCQGGLKAPCTPPVHIHLTQTETYKVLQGTYVLLVNGSETTLKAGSEPFTLPALTPHTFWPSQPAGEDGKCKIEMWAGNVGKGEGKWDEDYFRNSQSYYDDLRAAGMKQSMMQMVLFTVPRGIVLHFDRVPMAVTYGISLGAAFVAEHILGYSISYPEYSAEAKKVV